MSKFQKIVLSIVTIILVGLTFLWNYFCPIFNDAPKPTGPYHVGSVSYHWQNSASNIADPKYKEFNVIAYYPSRAEATKMFAYQPDKINALKKIIPEGSYIPGFVWNKLVSGISTRTEPNAHIAQSEPKSPVILYLPGIGSPGLDTVYLEELASHGYVLFSIEPPYDLLATVFPGNNIITIDPVLKKAIKDNNRAEIYKYRNEAHVRWNEYIESALEDIKKLNEDTESIFYQKLDLEKIGLMGHSHGGAVVTDFCQKNEICKAGINMDGWTKTYNTGQLFSTPFLFLLSESGEMPEMQDLFRNNTRRDFKKRIIKGAGHGAFNDGILTKWPLTRWFGVGSKNADHLRKEISEAIVTFFNQYLK